MFYPNPNPNPNPKPEQQPDPRNVQSALPSPSPIQDPDFGVVDYLGLLIAAVGFLCETLSDVQKYRFRSDDANKGKASHEPDSNAP